LNVLRAGKLILVKNIVLKRCSYKPGSELGFHKKASAYGNRLAGSVGSTAETIEITVDRPTPNALQVGLAAGLEMQKQEGGLALIDWGRGIRAALGFNGRADCATGAEMRVPKANVAWSESSCVVFDENGTGKDICNVECNVAHFYNATGSGGAHLEDNLRVLLVLKYASVC
jgi:hypothetical protein